MHKDALDTAGFGHAEQCVKMLLGGMNLSIGDEAHKVERAVARLGAFHRMDYHFVLVEFAGFDGLVDA